MALTARFEPAVRLVGTIEGINQRLAPWSSGDDVQPHLFNSAVLLVAAYYNLRGVAPPAIRTGDIYLGAIPFLALQRQIVAILVAFPDIASTPPAASRLTD